jgi:hypothetical protein
MTTFVFLALIVALAVLAPWLGADSRHIAGPHPRGNRGDYPSSPDVTRSDPWWDAR